MVKLMQIITLLKKHRLNVIQFFVLLYAFLLPFGHIFSNIILFFMAGLLLIDYFIFRDRNNDYFTIICLSSLFFIYLFSVLYSSDIINGLTKTKTTLVFLIHSLFLLKYRKIISNKIINKCIVLFVLAVLFVSITSIFFSFLSCTNIIFRQVCFTPENFSKSFITYHKLYFALYVLVAYVFTYFKPVSSSRVINYIVQFLLLGVLCFLRGRNSIIVAILFTLIYYSFQFLKTKRVLNLVIGSLVLFSILGATFSSPKLLNKFKEAINYNNEYGIKKSWGGTSVRLLIWKYSFKAVKDDYILGLGIGDVKNGLRDSYITCNESSALKGKLYNCHNQFIQIIVTSGLFGLVFFMISQCYLIRNSILKKNYLHLSIVLIFLFSCLTESILERDYGVKLFSFFSVLFYNKTLFNENSSNTQ